MDGWDTSIVYEVAMTRHWERVVRGEAAHRRAAALGTPPLRARAAAALLALARRLDPALARRRAGDDAGVPVATA